MPIKINNNNTDNIKSFYVICDDNIYLHFNYKKQFFWGEGNKKTVPLQWHKLFQNQ